MASLRGDATAKPQDYVRQLRVGGHDVVEDQWRGESDAVNQVLLNNMVAANPSQVCMEVFALTGGETEVTLQKDAATLVGVVGFVAATLIVGDLGITAAAINGSDSSQIDLTGTVVAGNLVVYYIAQ